MSRTIRLRTFISSALLWVVFAVWTNLADAQSTTSSHFEVASVRSAPADAKDGHWSIPGTGRFDATHVTFARLVLLAYGLDASQIVNQPGWFDTNLYDVDAKAEEGVRLDREELKPRLQKLLQERFHLVVHRETRTMRGYGLVIGRGGPHLVPTKNEHFAGWRDSVAPGQMRGGNWTMAQFAQYLTPAAGFPVIDRTGIAGSYDISFSYNPRPDNTSSDLPELNEALKQATGLVLKDQKVPVEVLVIDSVEKSPSEN